MVAKYFVIIPAAGVGQRFGHEIPKQYSLLNGKPIIEHTLVKFRYNPLIEKVVVAIHPEDYFWQQLQLSAYNDKIIVTRGGSHRCHSVFAALQALTGIASPQDFILVHDAVRPCIHLDDINKLIQTVGNHPVGGILGTRVRDTLKFANSSNEIVDTVSRENIWNALTPQMFRYQLLTQGLQQAIASGCYVTDEAQAIEALGFVPMMVEGRWNNIKITLAEDLLLAEKYLN